MNPSSYRRGLLSLDEKYTTERTQGFSINDDCVHEPQMYVELYGEEARIISQGDGPIANLSFSVDPNASEGSYHITLISGDLSDTSETAIPHLKMRGKFFVGEPPPVSIVCTPECDTTLTRGDTLTIYTTLTNHHWEGVTASVFMYGTVTPDSMNPFLVIDTTYVYLPPNGRVSSFSEIEVPGYAPLRHYVFTGYVCEEDNTYDNDSFGFDVVDSLGIMGGGGPEIASSQNRWRLITNWFQSIDNKEDGDLTQSSPYLPKEAALSQNYPNPFNPHTTIRYELPEGISRGVTLTIYNLRGHIVREVDIDIEDPGIYEYVWDGREESGFRVASGIYFYSLRIGDKCITKKMSLVR